MESKLMKIKTILLIAAISLNSSLCYSEHNNTPVTTEFSGTANGFYQVTNDFSLEYDGLVYFSFSADVQPSDDTTYSLNFSKRCENSYSSGVYYTSFGIGVTTLGDEHGPYALGAGNYSIKTTINSTQTVSYTTTVENYPQLLPNDVEPNDRYPTDSQEVGSMESGGKIQGHIGYACRYSLTDYDTFKFQVTDSGDSYFKIIHDQLNEACNLVFTLHDGMSQISEYLKKDSDKVFGPYQLRSGQNYYWKVSLGQCHDLVTKSWYGGTGYEIQYTMSHPPAPTSPFSFTSLNISPTVIFYNRNAKIHGTITNNTSNLMEKIDIVVIVRRVSDDKIIRKIVEVENFTLQEYQTNTFDWKLSDILGGQKNIDMLKEGKYMLTVWARNELNHESSIFVYFSFLRDPLLIFNNILLLNKKDKK